MSYYVFQPLLSFNARCWWQYREVRIDPQNWAAAAGEVLPVWVRFDSDEHGDGWVRCDPLPTSRDNGVVSDIFWFGVYKIGDEYVYEVRPAYAGNTEALWPRLEYLMDSNLDGYLGMWPASTLAGALFETPSLPSSWLIEGLDPALITPGSRHCNLKLFNGKGRAVRMSTGLVRSHLNDWAGVRGLLSLEVTQHPVPPHPRPLP